MINLIELWFTVTEYTREPYFLTGKYGIAIVRPIHIPEWLLNN